MSKNHFTNKYFIVFVISITFYVEGRVIGPSLNQLIKASDLIIIATIVNIDKKPFNKLFATARVDSILYGNPSKFIELRVSPTWTCDETKAIKNEKIILFAKKVLNEKYDIAWAGRGRMPIIVRSNSQLVSLLPDVIYTYDIMNNFVADTIQAKWGSYINRYATLDNVVNAIRENIKHPGQPLWDSFIGPDMFILEKYFERTTWLTENDFKMIFDGNIVTGANAKTLYFLLGEPVKKCLNGDNECWFYKKSKTFIDVRNNIIQGDECLCK